MKMIIDYYIRFIDELIESGKIKVNRDHKVLILPTDTLLKKDEKNNIEWYSASGWEKEYFQM